jgi:hypothetical protein
MIVVEADLPAVVVNLSVVARAEQNQVVEGRKASI